ncbi:cytochrome P450 [Wallemia mellicola]|nr:cytochrome P450 [Wallemia mellicola]
MAFDYTLNWTYAVGAVTLLFLFVFRPTVKRLPPGPRKLPIMGNAHQLIGKSLVQYLNGLAKQYGESDIMFDFVVNDYKIAKDLFETRHKVYSERPSFWMASQLMQKGYMMPFISNNERFKKVRKLLVSELRPVKVASAFHKIQTFEVQRLVKTLVDTPASFRDNIQRSITSIIMSGCYDLPIRSEESAKDAHKVAQLAEEIVYAMEAGNNIIDALPVLRHVPRLPDKVYAEDYYQRADGIYKGLMDSVKDRLRQGQKLEGIASRLLQSTEDQDVDYQEQYWALGAFYLAGSDTQSVFSSIMMMALALHPDILKNAQEEVDRVIGPDRLPTHEDELNLPYLKALIKEVFRWRPVGPIGIPHASGSDDFYNGYHIPKGSIVIGNILSMSMDERLFKDPHLLNPQRYIDDPELPVFVFGFGRRVCPGQHLAEATLLLEFSTIVWALNIEQARDEKGKPIPINTDHATGFLPGGLMKPHPFEIKITPRSLARVKLLNETFENLKQTE